MNTLSPSQKPTLEHYLRLNYPIEVVKDEDSWVASVPDLPGCASFGDSPNEAVENVEKAKKLWIESQYRVDGDIPEPSEEDDYSGKFVLRIPKILHRTLAYEATKQGVSLNHYASYLLAQRQPLNAFQNFAQSLFKNCSDWRTPWFYSQHLHGNVLMAGRLTADTEFLMYMRKPPAQATFKTSVPAATKKMYLSK